MKLRSLGFSADYLGAHKTLASNGLKLPSNVLLDDILCNGNEWQKHRFPIWAREIVAYPNRFCTFEKGRDVKDLQTGWILPASYIPESAYGKQFVGLFIDPGTVSIEKGRPVIHPVSVSVLSNFIQKSGLGGKLDEASGIPINVSPDAWLRLAEPEKRWFTRIDGRGLRPIMRLVCGDSFRQHVHAGCNPNEDLFVAAEGLRSTAMQMA
jgi:hypothetical protein